MGHIRLGRLPKSRSWSQVVDLLAVREKDIGKIAQKIIIAAGEHLTSLNNEPSLYMNYWLLTKLAWLSQYPNYFESLKEIGIDTGDDESAICFISKVGEFSRKAVRRKGGASLFGELADQSMREVLGKILFQKSETLFGQHRGDIQEAFRALASQKQFSRLSRMFFSSFLNRYIQFFVSKEISNHVGERKGFESIKDVKDFDDALQHYCFQSARIIEDFAGGWYSKRNWQGDISERDARGFVHVALKKIKDELGTEAFSK
jgi:hypothetical protein